MIMLELSQEDRELLDLPDCEALTGGTALCLAREDMVQSGEVVLPSAPTCWNELADAEITPLRYINHGLRVLREPEAPELLS